MIHYSHSTIKKNKNNIWNKANDDIEQFWVKTIEKGENGGEEKYDVND